MQDIRICIVEDESIEAYDIKRILSREGYEVLGIYSSGEQFLSSAQSLLADIVLMDIRLAGKLNGIETAQKFHQIRNIPVIFLTAYSDDQTLNDFYKSNPHGYLIKPVDSRELIASIQIANIQHKTNLDIERSERKYRNLFQNSMSANFIIDKELKIIDCNNAFVEFSGFSDSNELVGQSLLDFFQEDDLFDQDKLYSSISKKALVETDFVSKSGDIKKILLTLSSDSDLDDPSSQVRGIFLDISDRYVLQQQLKQSQKMEALGRLAGGIAHDFNNILTVILGYTILIPDKMERKISIDNDIDGIRNAADKAAALTKQLLALSRNQIMRQENIKISEIVRGMEKMLLRIVPENKILEISVDENDLNVYVDKSQIEMVILNLVINSSDAILDGGLITVKSYLLHLDEARETLFDLIEPGDYSVLSVRDNGSGIPKDILGKIFDPFFTTKTPDKGTGLGLSTVDGIVKQSGGHIEILTENGKGTEFRIYFKQSEVRRITQRKIKTSCDLRIFQNRKILIVEDDSGMRALMKNIFEEVGASVSLAMNPGEAILLIEEKHNNYDIIISDIVMPLMSGHQLIKRIRKFKKSQKAVFISGYSVNDQFVNETLKNIPVVFKPFHPDELLHAVSAELTANMKKENIKNNY
ncbi:MAG: response regulator [Spirochaetales bacterium]|nr:response regulator [Spirochaetales bacterium]